MRRCPYVCMYVYRQWTICFKNRFFFYTKQGASIKFPWNSVACHGMSWQMCNSDMVEISMEFHGSFSGPLHHATECHGNFHSIPWKKYFLLLRPKSILLGFRRKTTLLQRCNNVATFEQRCCNVALRRIVCWAGADINSDHVPVVCKVNIKLKISKKSRNKIKI